MYEQHTEIYRNINPETTTVLPVKLYELLHTTGAVMQLVGAMPSKPEDHCFDSHWCH